MKKPYGTLGKMSGYMMAPLISAAISFISIPIVTALLPKEVSGQVSMFVTYRSVISSFALLGMDQPMSRYYYNPPGKLTNKSLTSVCVMISLGALLIAAAGCFAVWKNLSAAIIGRSSLFVVCCLVLDILAHMILTFLNKASRLQDNMILYVIQAVFITITTKLSYAVVAYSSGTAIAAITVMTVCSLVLMAVFLAMKAKVTFALPKRGTDLHLKKIVSFGLPQIPVQLLATLNGSVSTIALKKFADYAAVGVYSIAISVTHAISLIQSSVNAIWAPYIYKNYQTKQQTIIKMHHLVSLAMIGAGLVLCLFEDLIYIILVDEGYWESKIYFPLLLISPICYTISETLGIGFKIAEKSYWNIPVYALAFGSNILVCCILIPLVGPIGAAIATAVSSILMMIFKSYVGERYYRCSDSYSKLIVAFTAMCIAMCGAIAFYESILRYILILVAIFVVIFVYRKEIKFLLDMVLFRRNKK